MKQLFTLCFIFFSLINSVAQNNSTKVEKNPIEFNPRFRFGILRPIQFGNSTYSKDIKSAYGAGFGLSLVSVYDFNLGIGADFAHYTVKNKETVGNFSVANTRSIQFEINRIIKINSDFQLVPFAGIGSSDIVFREKGKRRLSQTGGLYKVGCNTEYKLDETISAYFGLEYNFTKYNVQTIQELEDYYNKSNQISISIGFVIH